ncbi:MAG: methyltransferase domain-containing protein, partial [Candidatus Omnitrophica bacterium]|nr:methyltransferase domain-containing protein [Candidatus Omnitrophota bacterium]
MEEWTDRVSASVKNSYEFFEPEKTVLEELSKHKTILEVGSGMGRYTKLIPRVVGLEYSRPFLDHCRENIQGLFLRGDGFHIPFKDNSFDCVFSSGVLEHFDDRVRFAKEHLRVCKPGGKVVITVPAHESFDIHRYRLQVECLHPPEQKDWHVYGERMRDDEMKEILTQAGLSDIQIIHLGTPLRGWKANIKKYLGLLKSDPSWKATKGLIWEGLGFAISTRPFRTLTGDLI